MAEALNYEIAVSVASEYLADQSDLAGNRYVFAYTVTIRNVGTVAAQLISRHWVITDADGALQEVRGLGVVGNQPLLSPGQNFEYTSGCVLATPMGTMRGSYQMTAEDGTQFEAVIPEFVLSNAPNPALSMALSLYELARNALAADMPDQKLAVVDQIALACDSAVSQRLTFDHPPENERTAYRRGLPEKPPRVAPDKVPRRRPSTVPGRAALLHAIAHIEYSAIDLALDHALRFADMPQDYYADWLRVACEEARHFRLLRAHLLTLGHDYGDFPVHDGLWEMAEKTADDVLARMAMVPRLLEARGLDATPPIQRKLAEVGDEAAVHILDVILHDEEDHVRLGDHWFRFLCAERGLAPEPVFRELIITYAAPWPQTPMNEAARLAAGFSAAELHDLTAQRPAR